MPTTIDSLQIEIGASATSANRALDGLVSRLTTLKNSLGGGNFAGMQAMALGLKNISSAMQSLSGMHMPDYNRVAKGIERLGSINVGGINSTAQSIQALGNALNSTNLAQPSAQIVTLASSLAKLGSKSASNAITNIPKLALAFNQLIVTLSKAPSVSRNVVSLAQSMATLSSSGSKVSVASTQSAKGLDLFATSAKRAKSSTGGLAAAIGKIYASYWLLFRLFAKLGDAIDISSQITELGNVINMTFGESQSKIADFLQDSVAQFGMSEKAVKQYAARFQALGSAMAISSKSVENANSFLQRKATDGYVAMSDDMADVSLTLTKLTADMASFYDVAQEDIAQDLQAIFTGMTKPLRKYGLDLTQATLKEFALRNGLNADIKSMSQAEKTMLRYQYVLANTTQLQGDFERTSKTWHNQVTILKAGFEQLANIVGTILINAFKGLLITVNQAMTGVISAMQNVLNALGQIFGWTVEVNMGGLVQDAEDYSDALEDASDSSKKLKANLLGIDELNVLSDKNSGSGSGSDILSEADAKKIFSITDTGSSPYESWIKNLGQLGEAINKKLTDLMGNINWDSVYSRAKNFGKGLADFLNGLISPELFSATGETIAGALNTAVYSAISFGENLNWENVGISIASGINSFFEKADLSALASGVNTWVIGLLDLMIATVEHVKWDDIGRKIGEALLKIDISEIMGKFAKLIWETLNGVVDAYASLFKTAPFETALLSVVGLIGAIKVAKIQTITKALGRLSHATDIYSLAVKAGQSKIHAFGYAFPTVGKAIDAVTESMKSFDFVFSQGDGVIKATNAGLSTLSGMLSPLARGLTAVVGGFAGFLAVKDAVHDITAGLGSLASNIAELALGVTAAGVAFSVAFGSLPIGLALAGVTALIGAVAGLKKAFDEASFERFKSNVTDALTKPSGIPLEDLVKNTVETISGYAKGFDIIADKSSDLDSAKKNVEDLTFEIDKIKSSMDSGVMSVEEGTAKLEDLFGQMEEAVKTKLSAATAVLLATFGNKSAVAEAYEITGKAVADVTSQILQNTSEQEKKLSEYIEQLKQLPTGTDEWNRVYGEFVQFSSGLDEVQSSMDSLSTVASNGIDWSSYINSETGEVEMERLTNSLDSVYSQAEDIISRFNESIDSAKQAARDANDEETLSLIENGYADALASMNEKAGTEILKLTDSLQKDLVGGIDSIMDKASKDWEEMNFAEKLVYGGKFDAYAKETVEQYKKTYIDPVADEIEKQMDELGIDGAGWADEATKTIIDGLFNEKTAGQAGHKVSELRDDWSKALDNAFSSLDTGYVGKNIVDGIKQGMDDEIDTVAEESSNTIFDKIFAALCVTFMIASPAKAMNPIGEYSAAGIFEGFDLFDFMGAMTEWFATNVLPWFTLKKWAEISVGIKNGISKTWNDFKVWWSATGFATWWTSVTESFSANNWIFPGIEEGLVKSWQAAVNGAKAVWNNFADFINNNILRVHFDGIEIAGNRFGQFDAQLGMLPKFAMYAKGGFPEVGSLFLAGEAGAEMVGNINGKTGVASGAEITGIRDAIYDSSNQESSLLAQAVSLLNEIASKDMSVELDGRELVSAVNNRSTRNGFSFA